MPPMGMNLFIAMYRFDRPMLEIFRAVLPFVAILLLAVLIITYWPSLSLALVNVRSSG
jgi:TRAP-type C4-dicarboxylate transport system permease large subunit